MKLLALKNFVYEGKDIFKGALVDIKERDAVSLIRRGLIGPAPKTAPKNNQEEQSKPSTKK